MNLTEEDEKDNENEAQNNFPLGNTYSRKGMKLPRYSKEHKDGIIKEYLKLGLNAVVFARQKNMGYSTLKKWMNEYVDENGNKIVKPRLSKQKKINNGNNKNLFKELKVVPLLNNIAQEKKPTHIEIVVNNNVKLRMPGDTDINYLIKIIKGLSE